MGGLKRYTPLRAGRSHRGQRSLASLRRRAHMRDEEHPYFPFVRALPCISCAKPGPSDPAHMTLGANEKGTSLKVPDGQIVPLCRACHGYFDGHLDGPDNPFRHEDEPREKQQRWDTARRWVDATRLLAIPENLDEAFEFAELGLGRITHHATGDWAWVPFWADNLNHKEP